MMDTLSPRSGILLLTKSNNTYYVLLVKQRDSIRYGFPKGEIEGNIKESALRELKEETGILPDSISILKRFKSFTIVSRYSNKTIQYNMTVFLAYSHKILPTAVQDTQEIEEAVFVPYYKAIATFINTQPVYAYLIAYGIAYIENGKK